MRCASYCTASEYNINELIKHLNENGLEPKHFEDVIYVQKELGKDKANIDIFFFPFGATCIWGAQESYEQIIIRDVAPFEVNPLATLVSDFIYFNYATSGDKTYIDEEKNEIFLSDKSTFIKLSISHALAQSVKLKMLELSVTALLNKTDPIQKQLSKFGSITLSRKELSKQIGLLFSERYSINLHNDVLNTPEFFWRRPRYEPLYLMTVAFQDIQLRQNILNHRLDMIHELYNILSIELNYKHSAKLEIIIIILITLEVLIGITNHGFFWKMLENFLS